MKKTAIVIGIVLMVIVGSIWTIYKVRQQRSYNQYISKSSQSIISIAIDDLILDNLSSIISHTKSTDTLEKGNSFATNFIFDAGLSVPARIYLFSIPETQGVFYGILPVNNFDKCFSFFATHYPEQINFLDKQNVIVSVQLNKHLNVIFNNDHFIYQIGIDEKVGLEPLSSMLTTPENWIQISETQDFDNLKTKQHVSYREKSKRLHVDAFIKDHKTEINGSWQLQQELDKKIYIRELNTLDNSLLFWSVLPLKETPLLANVLQKYTGMEKELLSKNYGNYIDLQIKSDSVIQKDSSITYGFDDDFNPIEEIEVQQNTVPHIENAWKANKSLQSAIPDKMFYKFHKSDLGEYFLNTTLNTFPTKISRTETPYPVYCYINFEKLLEQSNLSFLNLFKGRNLNLEIITEKKDTRTLLIKGELVYQ